ncbi:ABC transporter ATP-binding protein [Zhihengliuella sp.]|uniref:ABC transporter ATP-binding protein n=1 Tax=Zhihengliuella sp. TaxID=1954483 RepID=UPI0028125648|nr:ABC transporter ATP-binding protein [Zhihengliuella sp.]
MSSSTPALTVDGLRKDFGPIAALDGRMVRVLHGIHLRAEFGAVTTLLGTNGAGKSTTLACAQGLLKPDGGTVSLLGHDPYRAGSEIRSRVGVMLQDGGLPPSVRPAALLKHVAGMFRTPEDPVALMARLGIDEFAHTPIRRLSGGQKQRVALAAALVGRPEAVFLDEPSAGLDPQSRQTVFELIRELRDAGLAIVLTTHLMDDAQRLSDYVYIIAGGRNVAEGTVAELTSHEPTEARVLELAAEGRLAADPGLTAAGLTVHPDGDGRVRIAGISTTAHLSAVTAWLERRGVLPTALSMQPRTLEDVFLHLAGGSAADSAGRPLDPPGAPDHRNRRLPQEQATPLEQRPNGTA